MNYTGNEFKVDRLIVKAYENRQDMGIAAAKYTSSLLKKILQKKEQIRMVFAAAPSQNEFLENLCKIPGINWSRIVAFHMDEYIGLPDDHPARFVNYLNRNLFDKVPFGAVHRINSSNGINEECRRYSKLVSEAPIDIVCLGIGENGHIAFNDPGVAHFNDPKIVKPVQLDQVCRLQQVNDGCFPDLTSVPKEALTLTIPTLTSADYMVCVVPGKTKSKAVNRTLNGPISEECPASILRRHDNCQLFLDTASFGGGH
ncbi:glucosamine-6-phosphate deaminase [Cytobacillus sp. Hz8]|uniref:glucosamine-6-phosphate deaminase n=1 Tax=Cytobacillus sp. Hz8 TaxID=3347168 RepID=UPI0035D6D4D9